MKDKEKRHRERWCPGVYRDGGQGGAHRPAPLHSGCFSSSVLSCSFASAHVHYEGSTPSSSSVLSFIRSLDAAATQLSSSLSDLAAARPSAPVHPSHLTSYTLSLSSSLLSPFNLHLTRPVPSSSPQHSRKYIKAGPSSSSPPLLIVSSPPSRIEWGFEGSGRASHRSIAAYIHSIQDQPFLLSIVSIASPAGVAPHPVLTRSSSRL